MIYEEALTIATAYAQKCSASLVEMGQHGDSWYFVLSHLNPFQLFVGPFKIEDASGKVEEISKVQLMASKSPRDKELLEFLESGWTHRYDCPDELTCEQAQEYAALHGMEALSVRSVQELPLKEIV